MSPRSKQPSRKGRESPGQYETYDERHGVSPAGTTESYYASSSTTAAAGPSPATDYEETLNTTTTTTTAMTKSKSIRSDGEITLQGPLKIAGSVGAGGNVTFNGDFDVRDKVEAYGAVEVNGNLVCEDKVKGFGKLRVTGTCEAKDLEIYGNTTINGFLKMTLYGSLTIVGPNSGYHAEEEEKIWGAIISREEDVGW
ncbi:uncharacterized protein ColSpa_04221 [Colletotrichum spaethianum]|uniref:Polymer-forming cytoskeletal protein n=1 Tax=Colletotrichum spaethianum TaxID=700344 RepID=A0AA37LCF9_9PEZI|nr:uncharacterized protein ColSpa_04221 [Colletotrichum spaethianum]GKT44040.1 hypothetical protein ColSpa_04221 [Colletotrichum spaethianum]